MGTVYFITAGVRRESFWQSITVAVPTGDSSRFYIHGVIQYGAMFRTGVTSNHFLLHSVEVVEAECRVRLHLPDTVSVVVHLPCVEKIPI